MLRAGRISSCKQMGKQQMFQCRYVTAVTAASLSLVAASGASAAPVQMVELDKASAVRVAAQAAGITDLVVCSDRLVGGRISGEFKMDNRADFAAFLSGVGVDAREVQGRVYVGCQGSVSAFQGFADGPQAPDLQRSNTQGGPGPVGPSGPLTSMPIAPSRVVLVPGGAPLASVLRAWGAGEVIGSDLILSGDDLEGAINVGRTLLACPANGEIRLAVVRVNATATREQLLGWFASLKWLSADGPADNQVRAGSRFGVSAGASNETGAGQVLLTARLAGSVYRQMQVSDGTDVPIQNATLTQTTGATQQSVTYRTVGVKVVATPLDFRPAWRAVMRVELSDVVGGSSLLPTIATSIFEGDLHGPGPQVLYGRARSSVTRSRGVGLTSFSRKAERTSDTVAVVADMAPEPCSPGVGG